MPDFREYIPEQPDFKAFIPNTDELLDKYAPSEWSFPEAPDTSEWLPEIFKGEMPLNSHEQVLHHENPTFRELVQRHGKYTTSSHAVQTEDGYILKMFRISPSAPNYGTREPVLL